MRKGRFMAKDIRLSRWAFLRVLTSLPTLAILTGTVFGGCGYDKVSIAELEDMARDGESMSDLNFYSANLTGADLSGADLRHAILRRADLRNANIDAIIWQAHRPVLSQPDRSQPDRGWE
jgi:hypothetical protein